MATLELNLGAEWAGFLSVVCQMENDGLMTLSEGGAHLSESGVAWMAERGLELDQNGVVLAARRYAQERRDEVHAEVGRLERALAESKRRSKRAKKDLVDDLRRENRGR